MPFTRTDLQYHYLWETTDRDSSLIRGFPDNILLNRNQGYEVIHFINRFISTQQSWQDETELSKRTLGRKIERMVHESLPGDIRSHLNVHQWIVANWQNH